MKTCQPRKVHELLNGNTKGKKLSELVGRRKRSLAVSHNPHLLPIEVMFFVVGVSCG